MSLQHQCKSLCLLHIYLKLEKVHNFLPFGATISDLLPSSRTFRTYLLFVIAMSFTMPATLQSSRLCNKLSSDGTWVISPSDILEAYSPFFLILLSSLTIHREDQCHQHRLHQRVKHCRSDHCTILLQWQTFSHSEMCLMWNELREARGVFVLLKRIFFLSAEGCTREKPRAWLWLLIIEWFQDILGQLVSLSAEFFRNASAKF